MERLQVQAMAYTTPITVHVHVGGSPPIHAHYLPLLTLTTGLPNPTNLLGRSKGPLFNAEASKFQLQMVASRFTGSAVHPQQVDVVVRPAARGVPQAAQLLGGW